jgi:hypothetical protein
VIDADRASRVAEVLDAGRALNQSGAAADRVGVTDQLLAGLVESCDRLGIPTGEATGAAYALGIVHALDLLERHLAFGPCLEAYVYALYCRAALLADRPGPKERP